MVVVLTVVSVPVPRVMVRVWSVTMSETLVTTPVSSSPSPFSGCSGKAVEVAVGTPELRGMVGAEVMGAVRVEPTRPEETASSMTEAEMLGASEMGQTVVVRATVLVTTTTVFSDSGRVAMSDSSAGQLVMVGAQLVTVATSVVMTVKVVWPTAGAVVLSLRKWKCS